MSSRRGWTLAAIVVLCLLGGAAYVIAAALGPNQVTTDAHPRSAAAAVPSAADLLVRAVDRDDPRLNGRVFAVEDGRPRSLGGDDLACERVYYAAGHGLCLLVAPSGVEYEAAVFNSSLHTLHRLGLTGLPSRARVSADGRYGAMTVFVSGHEYLSGGGFSTTTTIVDMRTGKPLAELEQFDVTKDGEPIDAIDFNFWGVTFAPNDSNRFYATLRTGDHYYLVEGDLRARSLRVLRDGVECPSLSPDGKQLVFKSRIGDENRWRLRVLDLATLSDHGVAEHRSIDDQADWLDNRTLVYSDGLDVYTVPADGSGQAQLLLRDATSPVPLVGSSAPLSGDG